MATRLPPIEGKRAYFPSFKAPTTISTPFKKVPQVGQGYDYVEEVPEPSPTRPGHIGVKDLAKLGSPHQEEPLTQQQPRPVPQRKEQYDEEDPWGVQQDTSTAVEHSAPPPQASPPPQPVQPTKEKSKPPKGANKVAPTGKSAKGQKKDSTEENLKFRGPTADRKCRDILFLALFVAFWVGEWVVAGTAFKNGEPSRLLYGTSSAGNQCGQNNAAKDLTDFPYLYYTFNTEDGSWTTRIDTMVRTCVKACPKDAMKKIPEPSPEAAIAIVNSTSYEDFFTTDFDTSDVAALLSGDGGASLTDIVAGCDLGKECYGPSYPARKVINYCFPDLSAAASSNISSELNTIIDGFFSEQAEGFSTAVGDLKECQWVILLCSFGTLGIAFLWSLLIKYLAGPMVWLTCTLSIFLAFLAATLCNNQVDGMKKEAEALNPTNPDYTRADVVYFLSVAMYIFASLVLLLFFIMFKRIKLVIRIVQVASDCIRGVPTLILFPLVPIAGVCVNAIWFVWVSLYLASAGELDKDSKTGLIAYTYDQEQQRLFAYHFFCFLWTNAFIGAIAKMTEAGAVAQWFCSKKGSKPIGVVLRSFTRTCFYSLGTCAFGSLLLAIVQFIRAVFNYMTSKSETVKESKIGKYLVACINCLLACFERCIKFMTRHAYIQCAITGKSFCRGAMDAVKILTDNALQVATLNVVGDLFLFLGKLMICAGGLALGARLCSDLQDDGDIDSIVLPMLVLLFISFAIASVFVAVFEVAMDTIFQCYHLDKTENKGFFSKQTKLKGILKRNDPQKDELHDSRSPAFLCVDGGILLTPPPPRMGFAMREPAPAGCGCESPSIGGGGVGVVARSGAEKSEHNDVGCAGS